MEHDAGGEKRSVWATSGNVHVLTLPWNATVTTSLRPLRRNWPELAWSKYGRQGRFLSAEAAQPGDHWTARFAQPQRLVRVAVHTGSVRYPHLVAPDGSELRVTTAGTEPRVLVARTVAGTASVALTSDDHDGGVAVREVALVVGATEAPRCLLIDAVAMDVASDR